MSSARNRTLALAASALLAATLLSCRRGKPDTAVIWTNNAEFASYAELFNSSHDKAKVVVVYKAEPAHSLPPARDEAAPDIIIGSWLKNSSTRKYFSSLNYLFSENSISRDSFYPRLIDYGTINEKLYLIPVSFNLPAMIFNKSNEVLVGTNHTLNLEQIKKAAENFSKKNSDGNFTAIGYAPSWDSEFLYEASKLAGASYREKGSSFLCDEAALESSAKQLREWTAEINESTDTEQNFQFKYLFMPKYLQVVTGRCLFAYAASDYIFTLTDSQAASISFRWIEQDGKMPVEDNITTLGLYKKSRHTKQAEIFISWLMEPQTQRQLIERREAMRLDTVSFGIANGFSSLREVNEKFYPTLYRQLFRNLPPEDYITVPNILPARWESLKSRVIVPWLEDNVKTEPPAELRTLEDRIADWGKQFF